MKANPNTTPTSSDCPDASTGNQQVLSDDLLVSLPDICYALDSEWRLIYANIPAQQWLHAGTEANAEAEFWDMLPENERSICREKLHEAADQHKAIRWQMNCGGQMVWMDATACPMGNGNLLVCYHDVSDFKRREDTLLRQEEALRQSEKTYRTLFETSAEGIIVAKPEGGIVLANQRMADMLGCPMEELLGKSSMDFTDSSLHPRSTHTRQQLDHGNAQQGEFEFHRKDGSVGWMMYNASPLFDEQGKHIGNLAMHTDITDRKRTEQDLVERDNRLRVVLNGMTDAFYFFDREWRFEEVNACGLELLFHRTREQLIGQVVWDLYPQAVGGVVWINYHQAVSDGHPRHFEALSIVNGHFYAYHIYPQAEGLAVYLTDITQRKAAQDVLTAQRLSLQALGESLAVEVETLRRLHEVTVHFLRHGGKSTIYDDILQAAIDLTGADRGDIHNIRCDGCLDIISSKGLSQSFLDSFATVDVTSSTCGLASAQKQRVAVEDITQSPLFQGTAGLKRYLDEGIRCAQSTPIAGSDGELLGVLSTHYGEPHVFAERELRVLDLLTRQAADMLQREKMEDELKAQAAKLQTQAVELEIKNKFITDFFINISHEFKTPLAIMLLGIDLLQEKARRRGAVDDFSKNLDFLRQNAYRLNRLVGNLLDITKLDAGFMEPDWESIDIIARVADIVKYTEYFAAQRGLRLTFHSNASGKTLVTDSVMLERILLNLLSNAIKHTPSGGEIAVACSAEENGIVLSVKDNGEGIPDDRKAIIFDRFQQVTTSLTRTSEGCGIGLSLCKLMVELLGGSIGFHSQSGVGSEFFVTLPVLAMRKTPTGKKKGGMELEKRLEMEFADIL